METSATLTLQTLRLWLSLGWTDAERAQKQPVDLDLTWCFSAAPSACETDNLEDTLCYHRCLEVIQTICQDRSFRLVEHLAATLADRLWKQASSFASPTVQARIQGLVITVHKLKPPVNAPLAEAIFRYEAHFSQRYHGQ